MTCHNETLIWYDKILLNLTWHNITYYTMFTDRHYTWIVQPLLWFDSSCIDIGWFETTLTHTCRLLLDHRNTHAMRRMVESVTDSAVPVNILSCSLLCLLCLDLTWLASPTPALPFHVWSCNVAWQDIIKIRPKQNRQLHDLCNDRSSSFSLHLIN